MCVCKRAHTCACAGVCACSHSSWAGDKESLCLNMKNSIVSPPGLGRSKKKKKETREKIDPNTQLKKKEEENKVCLVLLL